MRSLLAPALLLALAAPAAAQRKVDMGRAATSDVSVRIAGAFAALRVIGWERDSVALAGTLGTNARLEGGFGGAPGTPSRGVKMYIESTDDVVSGSLVLRVPARARVWVKAGSATVEASGVTGGLDLNVVAGSILVRGEPREVVAEAMDGTITIDGHAAYVRAKTASGDITMRGGGDDAGATTVSGAIRLGSGRWERVRLESVTGLLEFAGELARGASLTVDSHSGPIELRLPPRSDLDVDARTITGAIENGYSKNRPIVGREGRGQELGFSSGLGGAQVTLRSFKGNIRVGGR